MVQDNRASEVRDRIAAAGGRQNAASPGARRRHHLDPILPILLVALALRLVHVDFPVSGWHAWRQADTAAMARNFHDHGYQLWRPQVDWGGDTPGYVESEFPLYSFVVSLLYAMFGVRDLWGRLVAVACALGTVYVLYRLVRERVSQRVAAWAALVYAVAPLDIYYGRAYMPEAAMLFCSMLGVYAFARWMAPASHRPQLDGDAPSVESPPGRWRDAVVAWVAVTLAVLLKLPALYLGLPLLGLAVESDGVAALRRGRLWLFAILVLAPVALWYWHAHQLLVHGGVTFNIWGFGTDKWGNFDLLRRPRFYNDVLFKSIAERHLTWPGFVLFAVGLCLPRRRRSERLFDWWLIAVGIYILIVAKGNQVHEYYQLPVMLPASVFAGKALAQYLPLEPRALRARPVVSALVALCLVGLGVLSGLRLRVLLAREDAASSLFRLAAAVQRTTEHEALVVAVNESNPVVLYRCDRKGWNSSPQELDAAFLADKQRRGARYLIGEKNLFRGDAGLARLRDLLRPGAIVEDDPDYFVLRLLP